MTSSINIGFEEEAFAFENLSDYPDGSFCTLSNESIFKPHHLPFCEHRPRIYNLLLPGLKLASKLLIDNNRAFSIFINRKPISDKDEFVTEETDGARVTTKDISDTIIANLPILDMDPDMGARAEEHAYTSLDPGGRDRVVLDYNIITLLISRSSRIRDTQRITALCALAFLICHEMAHILEFRSTRKGQLRDSSPHPTPTRATCAEAGTAWETRLFGGKLHYLCEDDGNLKTLRGIGIQSFWSNYHHKNIDGLWLKGLFVEEFWSKPFSIRGALGFTALHPILTSDLEEIPSPDESTPIITTPSKKRKLEYDVVVLKEPRHFSGMKGKGAIKCGRRRVVSHQ